MLPSQTGATFTNVLTERLVAINRVTENGSGVALGDVDGDGWCDIYFCRLEGDNVLYRNLGGWRFEDMTASAGAACSNQLSTGAAFADIDGDGDLDLLVNSLGGGTQAFLNDGKGQFAELKEARLVKRFASTSLALGDIDLDGDLDLYVANYRTITAKDEFARPQIEARFENGKVVVTPPGRFSGLVAKGGNAEVFELAERDFLYLNTGRGLYAPTSWTSGNFLDEQGTALSAPPLDWGLSVMIRDLNDDGRPDIITCNDFFNSPDRVWIQQTGARFQAISFDAMRKVSLASMAVDVADINGDGLDDIFFAEMLGRDYAFRQSHRDNLNKALLNAILPQPGRFEVPRNTLFLNKGDGTYAEIAELAGVDASEWSWGAIFLDVDLDGRPDLIVPTGHNHDVQNTDALRRISQQRAKDSVEQRMRNLAELGKLETPIIAFHNRGALRFEEAQEQWGLAIPGAANGMACADLDNDGDLDLVVNRLNGPALLLRNDSPRNRIAVRLKGSGANTQGIGAKVFVTGGPLPQQQEIIAGGRYLSGDAAERMFACGTDLVSVEVRWPNFTRTVYSNLPPNRVYEFFENAKASPAKANRASDEPLFRDVSARLTHRNIDPAFDDFERQPLLPYSLATPGPAMAWQDVDGDGRDELWIGGGRGDHLWTFKSDEDHFTSITNGMISSALLDDSMGVLAVRTGVERLTVFVAHSNYESASQTSPKLEVITMPGGERRTPALPGADCPGALALADIDGDGDLDLFVAGRVLPGRYPAAASSWILRNDDGQFVFDADLSKPFAEIGLVSAAQFADINEDGAPDLLMACEWGPVHVFLNAHGHFEEGAFGLERELGWWTSVATGDFDNDGRTDIVVGNWGQNTKYNRFVQSHPLEIYHSDFDGNGTYDCFEAIFNPSLGKYVPVASPEMIIEHFPGAAERFPSYSAFAKAGLAEVLGRPVEGLPVRRITTMNSTCFLNRGSHFEPRPLPIEAQFAPVFGVAVADFDNDGNEDLLMGQNLFETRWETGRLDSGGPLLLLGDGRGGFKALSSQASGLTAEGQQRAVALADFNRDGRVDAAISQNDAATKLFENHASVAGLRIHLAGPLANPNAVGARYRVGHGPVREIHCGGGWLSQDSFTQVIPRPAPGARIETEWPGGKKTSFEIPTRAIDLFVSPAGVEVLR